MIARSISNKKSLDILLRCKAIEAKDGKNPMELWRYDRLIGNCYNHLGHPREARAHLEMAREAISGEDSQS